MSRTDDKEAFKAEAERLHQQFLAGMRDTYDRCKGMYGWDKVPLEIE